MLTQHARSVMSLQFSFFLLLSSFRRVGIHVEPRMLSIDPLSCKARMPIESRHNICVVFTTALLRYWTYESVSYFLELSP
jgi:hypothetical protein